MLTDQELETKLAASPAPRVTNQQIAAKITNTEYKRVTPTLTLAIINLDNGFNVTGESACVNPENYNEDIGNKIAFENAFRKLWALFGFLLAEDQFRSQDKKQAA